jgi:aspartate kinase
MLVMKFGGASVKDADSIRNVADIILQHTDEPLLIVISASGKTTNHLEQLAFFAKDGKEAESLKKLQDIKQFHIQLVEGLFESDNKAVLDKIEPFFQKIDRIVNGILMLEEFPPRTYDRIVSCGELLSTTIVAAYLQHLGKDCIWLDARKLIKTDASYKRANVIWSLTEENIRGQVLPQLKAGKIAITQGFMGSTTANHTTTLGREGSDYTASIFANCLDARQMMVWKDVRGILNADPRVVPDALKIDKLSYEEAVEMTFYGAKVIHPKTIKPIFQKNIPLQVKCFLDIREEGTRISEQTNEDPIPSYITKDKQALLHIKHKDFSFMDEKLMQSIFNQLYKAGVKLNLIQNSAVSLMLCVDEGATVQDFISRLLDKFEVEKTEEVNLYTVLNYEQNDLKRAHQALMVQQEGNKLFYVK